ncbi:XRE family transcriptional regulator [Hungatella hathewayi]|nr:XRE family transcriptional regulator [Hungatella hathewayi]
MNIGERIRGLREKQEMTQTELAEKIGSTKQTVYKYENGVVTNIPYDKLILLAKALGTTPSSLMGWDKIEELLTKNLHA